jgi:hypothetical protein
LPETLFNKGFWPRDIGLMCVLIRKKSFPDKN